MGFVISNVQAGPKKHKPVVLLIDKSRSISHIREQLNQIIRDTIQMMKNTPELHGVVALLVIHFDKRPHVAADFVPLADVRLSDLEIGECSNSTNIGKALLKALECIDRKKEEWKDKGDEYCQPLCILFSDGRPDPGIPDPERTNNTYLALHQQAVMEYDRLFHQAAQELRKRVEDQKLIFVAAGVQDPNGVPADMEKLRELTNDPNRVLNLSTANGDVSEIKQFFTKVLNATNALSYRTPTEAMIDALFGLN